MGYTIITGATGGLGRAFAEALLARGESVLLVGRSGPALEEAFGTQPAERVRRHCADLESWNPALAISLATESFGKPPIGLIHCAGVSMRAPLEETRSRDAIDRCFRVNVTAAIELTCLIAPDLARHRGHVVFVSSLAQFAGMRDYGVYGACKRALSGFADSLEAEFHDRGLRVLTVYPGEMKSGLQASELDGDGHAYGARALFEGPFVAPSKVASDTLDALQRRRRSLFVPRTGRLFALLCHLLPGLVRMAMRQVRPGDAARPATPELGIPPDQAR